MSDYPNILFIVLDSARARNTSLLGYHRETTPNIEAMDGTTYTNARAPSVWSLPSHVSMFTGDEAHEHGLKEPMDVIDSNKLLMSELSEEGYKTGAFTDNLFVSMMDNGIKESFDFIGEASEKALFENGLSPNGFTVRYGRGNRHLNYVKQALKHNYPVRSLLNGAAWKFRYMSIGERLNLDRDNDSKHHSERCLEWSQSQNKPWFSFINFMDTHEPYAPEKAYSKWEDKQLSKLRQHDKTSAEYYKSKEGLWVRKAMENLYDGTIRQADEAIGWLIDQLKKKGLYDKTLIIITGDHGEGFIEQSEIAPSESLISHRYGISEELLHVPLKIKYPHQSGTKKETKLAPLTKLYNLIKTYAQTGNAIDVTADEAKMFAHGGRHQNIGKVTKSLVQPVYAKYHYNEDGSLLKTVANNTKIIRQLEIFSPTSKREVECDVPIEEFHKEFETEEKQTTEQTEVSDELENRLEDLGYM